jgi:hypothetical protein
LPEFEVSIRTQRSGTLTLRVYAPDAASALALMQAECAPGACHCPPEWCTDDVESTVVQVRAVVAATVGDRSGEHGVHP